MRQAKGFTLIEVMIAVVVVAILSGIAYPAYRDHIRRTNLQEAFANLSDFRLRMEQYYQDNRTYANAGACGVVPPAPPNPKFNYTVPGCETPDGQSYTMTAAGIPGTAVDGFTFTINQRGVRATTSMHADWGALPDDAAIRWVMRKP